MQQKLNQSTSIGKQPSRQLMHSRNSFGKKIFKKRDYQKSSKQSNSIFFFKPNSFFKEIFLENKRGRKLVTSPVLGCQIYLEIFFLQQFITWPLLMSLLKNVFESFQKLQLVIQQVITWHRVNSVFNFLLKSQNFGQKIVQLRKFKYLKN